MFYLFGAEGDHLNVNYMYQVGAAPVCKGVQRRWRRRCRRRMPRGTTEHSAPPSSPLAAAPAAPPPLAPGAQPALRHRPHGLVPV